MCCDGLRFCLFTRLKLGIWSDYRWSTHWLCWMNRQIVLGLFASWGWVRRRIVRIADYWISGSMLRTPTGYYFSLITIPTQMRRLIIRTTDDCSTGSMSNAPTDYCLLCSSLVGGHADRLLELLDNRLAESTLGMPTDCCSVYSLLVGKCANGLLELLIDS